MYVLMLESMRGRLRMRAIPTRSRTTTWRLGSKAVTDEIFALSFFGSSLLLPEEASASGPEV